MKDPNAGLDTAWRDMCRTTKECLMCRSETTYENQLCGPCYNVGFRGIGPNDTVLVDRKTLIDYIRCTNFVSGPSAILVLESLPPWGRG